MLPTLERAAKTKALQEISARLARIEAKLGLDPLQDEALDQSNLRPLNLKAANPAPGPSPITPGPAVIAEDSKETEESETQGDGSSRRRQSR